MATTEAVSEGTLERQKAMKLSRYRTCYLHIMLKEAKLFSYCLMKSVEGKTFWIHKHLQTRTEAGQESEDVIFIFMILLPWSISKSTSIVVFHPK